MDKENQIKEMTEIISKQCIQILDELEIGLNDDCPIGECADCEAIRLYNKGYRKASEVINEFVKELIKRFNDMEYNANTPRKTVKVDELRAQVDWILHEVTVNTIKEFAEKYVEAMK